MFAISVAHAERGFIRLGSGIAELHMQIGPSRQFAHQRLERLANFPHDRRLVIARPGLEKLSGAEHGTGVEPQPLGCNL